MSDQIHPIAAAQEQYNIQKEVVDQIQSILILKTGELTAWEDEFCDSIVHRFHTRRRFLTPRQLEKACQILAFHSHNNN